MAHLLSAKYLHHRGFGANTVGKDKRERKGVDGWMDSKTQSVIMVGGAEGQNTAGNRLRLLGDGKQKAWNRDGHCLTYKSLTSCVLVPWVLSQGLLLSKHDYYSHYADELSVAQRIRDELSPKSYCSLTQGVVFFNPSSVPSTQLSKPLAHRPFPARSPQRWARHPPLFYCLVSLAACF